MVTPVRGAKPPGALAPELAKPAVEIRQVIESRSKADLYNREVRFDEKAASLAHPELRQVIDKGLPDRLPEKTTELVILGGVQYIYVACRIHSVAIRGRYGQGFSKHVDFQKSDQHCLRYDTCTVCKSQFVLIFP